MKHILAFTLGMLLIGSFFVVNKQVISDMPIFIASELRLLMGTIALYGILKITGGSIARPDRQDMRVIFYQAFFGVFLFSIFSLYGLKHTSAINSGIIMGATPVVIFLIAIFLARERATPKAMGAALAASLGVIAINIANSKGAGASSLTGDFLVMLAMLCEAIFIISGRFIRGIQNPIASSTLTAAIGAAMFMPFAIYSAWDFAWASVSSATWLCVTYTGIGIAAIGVLLMNYGANGMPLSKTASLSAFMPASGCVLAILILGESFNTIHLLGLALIIASALITSQRNTVFTP